MLKFQGVLLNLWLTLVSVLFWSNWTPLMKSAILLFDCESFKERNVFSKQTKTERRNKLLFGLRSRMRECMLAMNDNQCYPLLSLKFFIKYLILNLSKKRWATIETFDGALGWATIDSFSDSYTSWLIEKCRSLAYGLFTTHESWGTVDWINRNSNASLHIMPWIGLNFNSCKRY